MPSCSTPGDPFSSSLTGPSRKFQARSSLLVGMHRSQSGTGVLRRTLVPISFTSSCGDVLAAVRVVCQSRVRSLIYEHTNQSTQKIFNVYYKKWLTGKWEVPLLYIYTPSKTLTVFRTGHNYTVKYCKVCSFWKLKRTSNLIYSVKNKLQNSLCNTLHFMVFHWNNRFCLVF